MGRRATTAVVLLAGALGLALLWRYRTTRCPTPAEVCLHVCGDHAPVKAPDGCAAIDCMCAIPALRSGAASEPSSLPSAPVESAPLSTPCAGPNCRLFASAADAFRAVLASNPRVLGIGESHALAAAAQVPSATRRFTDELLPLLAGRASDLVVEIMLPNPACARATESARQEQKVVTSAQAPSDQNEFVGMAAAAQRFGIVAHPLRPTCDDLSRIAAAGDDAVATSLTVVTRLLSETAERLLARGDGRLIVVYGGALHNDAAPDAEHAAWSYAPALTGAAGGRYVELDLVVPEFVKDTPAWRSLPWFDAFHRDPRPGGVTLYRPGPVSYAMLFARSE